MRTTELGEAVFSSSNLIEEIYRGNLTKLDLAKVDPDDSDYQKYLLFVNNNKINDWPLPEPYVQSIACLEDFDRRNQQKWFIPDDYADFDIVGYLYSLCKTKEESERVIEELQLFDQHNMIDVLKFLKYLVDTMRENNILWGVGRGSSVASYCLYLLGVHKINSLKYDLDIREFLK